MRPFLRSSDQSRSFSQGSSLSPVPYHSAASKRLEKQRATPSRASSPASDVSSAPNPPGRSHEYPLDDPDLVNTGIKFNIQWDAIWKGIEKLPAHRIGYRVVNKRYVQGGAARSDIYKYGADLIYQDAKGSHHRVWLCQNCHKMGKRDCAKFSSSTHHIKTHLEKLHKISFTLGFLPTPQPPKDPFEVVRAIGIVVGSNN